MKKLVVLSKRQQFEAKESGLFAKDVLPVGKLFHPVTEKELDFTPERVAKLATETQRYHDAGNKIPFRDGHRNSVLANMGHWPGPFVASKDCLAAVCEPKDPKAIEGMKNGSIDGVSVVIEFDVTDSKKNHYDEVITAIDATDFPVYPGQGAFTALSKEHGDAEIYVDESLKLDAKDGDPSDCHAQMDGFHKDLKARMKEFAKVKAKHGADHAETKAAGAKVQEAAARFHKQAQVVHDNARNMSGAPVYYDRETSAACEALVKSISSGPVSLESVIRSQ